MTLRFIVMKSRECSDLTASRMIYEDIRKL